MPPTSPLERARTGLRRLPFGRRLMPDGLRRLARPGQRTPEVAILGAGFAGIAMAVRLRQSGVETFTVYEKNDGVGGTWRDNTYPGAACDVPSHLYSYSFATKADWSRKFATQPEILAYLEDVTDRFGVRPHLALNTEITSARWDPDAARWELRTASGTTRHADVLVGAVGQLNVPSYPDLPGRDDFAGHAFHSARWDHDHDLRGRSVAVIGTGASAVQFVPHVVEQAASTTVFQRSANYVAPKPDAEFGPLAKWCFTHVPGLERAYRWKLYWSFEARFVMFRRDSRLGALVARQFSSMLGRSVSDRLPASVVIPDYRLGCKRVLISNDWFPALSRPEVTVVTDPIERIAPDGVVTADGTLHRADTLIWATGFRATDHLGSVRIEGEGGRALADEWADGAQAHLGITVAGFPNLFLLYGPNTNLGHNSVLIMLERQVEYVLDCLDAMIERDAAAMAVRRDAQEASNRTLQERLAGTVWAEGCRSWYKTASGRITQNWSGPTVSYIRATLRPHLDEFEITGRSGESGSGVTAGAGAVEPAELATR